MERLKVTNYVGGDHEAVVAAMNRHGAAVITRAAADVGERLKGLRPDVAARRDPAGAMVLEAPGFVELDGAEIEVTPVGTHPQCLTRLTVRAAGPFDAGGDQFLSVGLFSGRASASLQTAC